MLSINEFFDILDKRAPLYLSKKIVALGDYDNSGILVKLNDNVNRVLFTLDLTEEAVKKAKLNKCDTIVTHHPAIYYPIKEISKDDMTTKALGLAVKNGLNVISMHLNLDVAENGIDYYLSLGLGAKNPKVLDFTDSYHGYGRVFDIEETQLNKYVEKVKKEFNTKKVIYYGKRTDKIRRVASFCGAGSSYAKKEMDSGNLKDVDLIVTSDIPHHLIKEFSEYKKDILILTHYASENYGLYRFYKTIEKDSINKVTLFYFTDKKYL